MWCRHCRQDVPALSAGDNREYCCPRCGEAICLDAHQAASGSPEADPGKSDSPSLAVVEGANQPPSYDGWEVDEELRHIERLLQTGRATSGDVEASCRPAASRFDLPHANGPAWHVPAAGQPDRQRKTHRDNRGSAPGFITWLALSLGTTGFVCGGVLLGWSLATGRQELWSVGLPVALVGQIALLIGLVLQLDRLWHDNREAAAKLDNVDEQLHDLKATTTLLGTHQGSASSRFYAHFAGGAGPQLLLADLKSQLDLLAMKIAQEER